MPLTLAPTQRWPTSVWISYAKSSGVAPAASDLTSPFGREDVDLLLGQLPAQVLGELARVVLVGLPVEQRLEPLELDVGRVAALPLALLRALLVAPVRGDAVLRCLVHVAGADLDLERPALGPDHGRVERLVHVELGHGDHVLEPPRQRLPQRVDHAHGAVAVLHGVDDHPHRREVVDLVELAVLAGHLRVDRVEVLGAARDLGVDAERLELLGQVAAGARDVALALLPLLVHQALDLLVLARVQRAEGEVLELPLDRVDAEPVGQGRVDLERLLGLLDLLLLGHRFQRAHVVEAVGQLDEDDPDVRGHRDHHLAVVLGLRLVARLERDAGELGDAVDEAADLLAERLADLVERRRRVLDRVVQEGGAQRLGVEPHAGADLGHADRVDDELLAGPAALVGVVLAGEDEGLDDARAVDRLGDLVRVLGDDREQVGHQLALERREVGRDVGDRAVRLVGAVDGPVAGDRHRRVRLRRAAGDRRGRAPSARSAAPRPRSARSAAPRPPERASGRLPVGVAAQVSPSVLEPSMVRPEGRRALQRGPRRPLDDPEGRPLAIEDDEIELGEDPHQAPCERGRPRVRPLAPKHRLERLTADVPETAQRAVQSCQRVAEGEVPLMYSSGKA